MGDCRNRSEPIPFVPLRPTVVGAAIINPIPFNVEIDLQFSEPMNVGLAPGNVNVEIIYDGNPAWGTFSSWTDATHARYVFAIAWPPAAATVQLKVLDPNLKNLPGGICRLSDPIVIVP